MRTIGELLPTSLQSTCTVAKALCNCEVLPLKIRPSQMTTLLLHGIALQGSFNSPAILLTRPGKPAEFWLSVRKF